MKNAHPLHEHHARSLARPNRIMVAIALALALAGCATDGAAGHAPSSTFDPNNPAIMDSSSLDSPVSPKTRIDALDVKGVSAFMSGDFTTASEDFSKAIYLSPNDPGSWFNMGYLYYTKQNFPMALAIFSRLSANKAYTSKDVKFAYVYGDTLCMSGMPNRGVQVLQASLPYMTGTQHQAAIHTIKSCLRKVKAQ